MNRTDLYLLIDLKLPDLNWLDWLSLMRPTTSSSANIRRMRRILYHLDRRSPRIRNRVASMVWESYDSYYWCYWWICSLLEWSNLERRTGSLDRTVRLRRSYESFQFSPFQVGSMMDASLIENSVCWTKKQQNFLKVDLVWSDFTGRKEDTIFFEKLQISAQ